MIHATTPNTANINDFIQKSIRLRENENEHSTLVEALNTKEKFTENDTQNQLHHHFASKEDDTINVNFFKNMTNNQANIETRKQNVKYSDSEELDVEAFSGDDENKGDTVANTTNLIKSRSKSRSRSTSNSKTTPSQSPLNLEAARLRRLSCTSMSSAASSSLEQNNTNNNHDNSRDAFENNTHTNLLKPNLAISSRRRSKIGFKRYQRPKGVDGKSFSLQMNSENRNFNSNKQVTASILINGKRYYRKFEFSCLL